MQPKNLVPAGTVTVAMQATFANAEYSVKMPVERKEIPLFAMKSEPEVDRRSRRCD